MKRFFFLSISIMFMFGVLFPVSRTSEGKSPLFEQIKKIFHYSSGVTGKEKAEVKKGYVIIGEGDSALFQEIKNIFHYFPGDIEKPKVKEYPPKFDEALEKELRYPPKEEAK